MEYFGSLTVLLMVHSSSTHAAQTAHATLFCWSLRFQQGQGPFDETLDLLESTKPRWRKLEDQSCTHPDQRPANGVVATAWWTEILARARAMIEPRSVQQGWSRRSHRARVATHSNSKSPKARRRREVSPLPAPWRFGVLALNNLPLGVWLPDWFFFGSSPKAAASGIPLQIQNRSLPDVWHPGKVQHRRTIPRSRNRD